MFINAITSPICEIAEMGLGNFPKSESGTVAHSAIGLDDEQRVKFDKLRLS